MSIKTKMIYTFLTLAATAASTSAFGCTSTYTVQPGDTLTHIAEQTTGSVFNVETLVALNQDMLGATPDVIHAGAKMILPCKTVARGQVDWSVMPGPATLDRLIQTDAVQVLDIRSPKAVAKGVIPGAIHIPYNSWRDTDAAPGAPPSNETLARLIGTAGLQLNAPIIIVNDKPNMMDTGRAAFVYWLLKSSGATELAILHGSHQGWVAADLPVADYTPTPAKAYQLEVTFTDRWRADSFDIFAIATDQINGHLLDARPHKFFHRLSDAGKAIGSTLPGAQSAPVQPLLAVLSGDIDIASGVAEVVNHLDENAPNWQTGDVISFCNSGELAALNWFYASELAGLAGMRLYPESLKGWTADGGNLAPGQG